MAEKLIDILGKYSMNSTILTINRFQIIARKRELELEERKTLAQIKYSENIFARCCACILLKQFDEFDIHMQQLSATEKEEFYSWPIASLLPNVEKMNNTEISAEDSKRIFHFYWEISSTEICSLYTKNYFANFCMINSTYYLFVV